jgi:hypothetical protein
MPPLAILPTSDDHATWARCWAIARGAWRRTEDLADELGLDRTTIAQYCSGARHGEWNALLQALLRTGRERPHRVQEVVAELALHLLDARGTWIPERAGAAGLGTVAEEAGDVTIAIGELLAAARRGAGEAELAALGQEVVRQAVEVAAAARRSA